MGENKKAQQEEQAGRAFFRIPIENPNLAKITINGKSYDIINLANSGVGIYLDNADTFFSKDEITNITLTINDKSCQVNGKIVHVSPTDINYMCGIELINMSPEAQEILHGFIDNHKASLFSFMPD